MGEVLGSLVVAEGVVLWGCSGEGSSGAQPTSRMRATDKTRSRLDIGLCLGEAEHAVGVHELGADLAAKGAVVVAGA